MPRSVAPLPQPALHLSHKHCLYYSQYLWNFRGTSYMQRVGRLPFFPQKFPPAPSPHDPHLLPHLQNFYSWLNIVADSHNSWSHNSRCTLHYYTFRITHAPAWPQHRCSTGEPAAQEEDACADLAFAAQKEEDPFPWPALQKSRVWHPYSCKCPPPAAVELQS